MALASLGAAAIHLSTAGEHVPLFAAGFLAMAAYQIAWAALVFLRPGGFVFVIGLAGQTAIVATWLAAHTAGLPFGPGAGQPEPSGFKDVTATILELLVIGGCVAALRPGSLERLKAMVVPQGLAIVATIVLTAFSVVAVISPHAHGPRHDHAPAADHHEAAAGEDHEHEGASGQGHHKHRERADGHHAGRHADHHDHGAMTGTENAHEHSGAAHEDHEGKHEEREGHEHRGSGSSGHAGDHDRPHAHIAAEGGGGPFTYRWEPADIDAVVGTEVVWVNNSDDAHHVTFYDGPIRKELHLDEGEEAEVSLILRKPGTYLYRCDLTYHSELVAGRCVGQCGSITVSEASVELPKNRI